MTLDTIPRNLWQVTVPNNTNRNRVFTTRDEVRAYRRTLRVEGFTNDRTMRFAIASGTTATL